MLDKPTVKHHRVKYPPHAIRVLACGHDITTNPTPEELANAISINKEQKFNRQEKRKYAM
jgi:hypothetical protein